MSDDNGYIIVRRPTSQEDASNADGEDNEDETVTPRPAKQPSVVGLDNGNEPYVTPVALQKKPKSRVAAVLDDTEAEDSEIEREIAKLRERRKNKGKKQAQVRYCLMNVC